MKEVVLRTENIVVVEPKEVEMVRLLADDLTIAQAAKKIGKNNRTVEAKVSRIKAKYGAKTLQGLVSFFYRHNLFD